MEQHRYPWYSLVVGDSVQQGDLLPQCPIIVPIMTDASLGDAHENDIISARLDYFDIIILTQSCDLTNEKVDYVVVCPYFTAADFIQRTLPGDSPKKAKDLLENIRRGRVLGYHLLAACEVEGFEQDMLVVDFRRVFSVPKRLITYLAERTPQRLRLMPPYREHLSQAFGQLFMRVGLPIDIPKLS